MREPNEYQINRIAGSTLIPLGELPRRYQELPRDREIITQCKMGGRSAKAQEFLKSVGFTQREEPQGRDSGVDRQGRPEPAEVLSEIRPFLTDFVQKPLKYGLSRSDYQC